MRNPMIWLALFSTILLTGCVLSSMRPGKDEALAPNESAGDNDSAIQAVDRSIAGLPRALPRSNPAWRTALKAPAPVDYPTGSSYFWTIETNIGTMKFRLRPDLAPYHVTNLVYLTRLRFYDGLGFHRILPGFVAQGGCPLGTGAGSPGYRFDGELHGRLKHNRPGMLSTANAGPGTDGCQFFITLQKAPHLDGKHTIFGEIVYGLETLRAIEMLGTRVGTPSRPVTILEARVTVARGGFDPEGWRAEGRIIGQAGDVAQPVDIIDEIDAFIESMKIDRDEREWRTQLPRPPSYRFPTGRRFVWEIETTAGPLEVTLWPHVAPTHVSNIIYLTRLGFYEGLEFHRIIPGFMAQGGCPLGDGTGTPGYRFDGEIAQEVRHDRRGLLCMANSGPNTDGCQFYVTFIACPHLDGKDTVFGEVTQGLVTLDRLEEIGSRGAESGDRVVIESARIIVE